MDANYNFDDDKREWWEYVVLAIGIILLVVGLSSCTTIKYVPVEKVVTKDSVIIKTEYVDRETKVKEYVAGDTVYRDSIVFCTILRCDTIYSHSVDSIPYPVEVVKEVERSLNKYEKTMIRFGWCFLFCFFIIFVWNFAKWYFKR